MPHTQQYAPRFPLQRMRTREPRSSIDAARARGANDSRLVPQLILALTLVVVLLPLWSMPALAQG